MVSVMHENLKLEKWKMWVTAIVAILVGLYGIYKIEQTSQDKIELKKMELCLKDKSLHWCKK